MLQPSIFEGDVTNRLVDLTWVFTTIPPESPGITYGCINFMVLPRNIHIDTYTDYHIFIRTLPSNFNTVNCGVVLKIKHITTGEDTDKK